MIINRKKKTHLFLLILLLILGIGFAALAATLKINGTITIDSAKWDVHFENVSITEGSVTATTVPTSDDATTTEMTYAVDFTKPGDFYEFTVDMANDGTIDAMVNLVTNKVYSSDGETEKQLPAYLKSTVTYNDGAPISKNQLLSKQTSEKIKVRVEFRSDVDASDLPSTNETTVFKFSSTFKQADETSCQRPTTFENDSWDVIQCNVKNNPQSYPVGATKNIEMDIDGDNTNETYTLRVANNTTPSECSNEGFSQSACGFVVEFADIIMENEMNPFNNTGQKGDGNIGGWEYSEVRTLVNETIYGSLPQGLKNKIIKTRVISGHGTVDTSNYDTLDYLYLLSTTEVGFSISYDSAANQTRILDYYNNQDNNHRIKKENNINHNWWLRTAPAYNGSSDFSCVSSNGDYNGYTSYYYMQGVSPVFRIG